MCLFGHAGDLEPIKIGVENLFEVDAQREPALDPGEQEPINTRMVRGDMKRAEGREPVAQIFALAQPSAGSIEASVGTFIGASEVTK